MSSLAKPLVAGVLSGACCYLLTRLFGIGSGDFTPALRAARDLLAGRDPYAFPPGPYAIPYPLPAAFIGVPFAALPDSVAGALFIGLSTTLLTWGFVQARETWRIGMFFSWPFLYATLFVQWSPLLCAMWFLPFLAPLVLVKPNIGLPIAAAARPGRWSMAASIAVLALSLAIYPTWPVVWISQLASYQGTLPPLFTLPLGPLMLLSLLRWRDRRAQFLLAMALMPQRMFYDQFPLLLIARNNKELFSLVACSWASFCALWLSDSLAAMPGSWRLWVVLAHYLPALAVLLWPMKSARVGPLT